jgi:hypothetical protein
MKNPVIDLFANLEKELDINMTDIERDLEYDASNFVSYGTRDQQLKFIQILRNIANKLEKRIQ